MVMERMFVPSDRVHDVVSEYVNDGYGIMTMFAEEGGTVNILMRRFDSVVVICYDIEGHAVPLSDITWNASLYERLMSEMSGVTFSDSNEGTIVYRRKGNGHPLQKEGYDRSTEVRIPIPKNRTVGDDIFEIPVGPVHAGIIEPGHFRFSVAGETVIELNPTLGFVHRGIERLMETSVDVDNSRLVERISGDTCVANCIAYSEMMESDVDIPMRAKYIRTILAEMERLYNHRCRYRDVHRYRIQCTVVCGRKHTGEGPQDELRPYETPYADERRGPRRGEEGYPRFQTEGIG